MRAVVAVGATMQIDRSNLNEFGQLVGFRLHDATMTGFSYDQKSGAELVLQRLDGTTVRVRLSGVGQLGTNGFRAPAIVADVYAWNPSETPPEALRLQDGAWNVLFANELRGDTLRVEAQRIVQANEFAYLVLVACSFGGAVAAVCKGIDVSEMAPA